MEHYFPHGNEASVALLRKDIQAGFGRRFPNRVHPLTGNEFVLDNTWRIVVPKLDDGCLHRAGLDLQNYLFRCRGLRIEVTTSKNAKDFKKTIRASVNPKNASFSRNKILPGSHFVKSLPGFVEVIGYDQTGAMHGLHYLAKLLDFRQAPVLKTFKLARQLRRKPRLVHTLFSSTWDNVSDKMTHPDKYLSLMAHYGCSGIWLYVGMKDYCRSRIIPELNGANPEKHLEYLARLVERAGRYGLSVYLHLDNDFEQPADSKIFCKYPDIKGAELAEGGVHQIHCLCSSNQRVINFYGEVTSNIFRAVPELAGVILIVGGEGFLHCYSNYFPWLPKPRPNADCPVCEKKEHNKVVANLVNNIADAVKKTAPEADVVVWPYNGWFWSGDVCQEKMIRLLSRDVVFLDTCDKEGMEIGPDGRKYRAFDYSLTNAKPSTRFMRQLRQAKRCKLKVWVKTESANDLHFISTPYIPALWQWAERYQRLANLPLDGSFEAWVFYGFTGSLSEEVADWLSWDPSPKSAELLRRIAERDFGPSNADTVLIAWEFFSEAIKLLPQSFIRLFCHNPCHTGPAHPFVLERSEAEKLRETFYRWMPGYGSARDSREGPFLDRKQPAFAVELDEMATTPREKGPQAAPDVVLKAQQLFLAQWEKGLGLLEKVGKNVEGYRREQVEREIGIARTIYHSVRSTISLIKFYMDRDAFEIAKKHENRKRIAGRLLAIAEEEMKNAQEFLPFARRDRRLGYGGREGVPFTPEMIEAKIAHLKGSIAKLKKIFGGKQNG